jgi:hypothetical protein
MGLGCERLRMYEYLQWSQGNIMEDDHLEQQGDATLIFRWILGKYVTRIGGGLFSPCGVNSLGYTTTRLLSLPHSYLVYDTVT